MPRQARIDAPGTFLVHERLETRNFNPVPLCRPSPFFVFFAGDNRFSHLINSIISHVGLFPRWYRFRNAWQYQPTALADKKCRYRRMRDVIAKLHYLHAISLKRLYLPTNPLPFSAPTRTYRMYPRSACRQYSILRISFPKSIFQDWRSPQQATGNELTFLVCYGYPG